MTSSFRKSLSQSSLAVALGVSTLMLTALSARGIIDATLQMQLGNPSGAMADTNNYSHYLIQRPVEAIDYNATLGQANWVSWDLTAGDDSGAVSRSSTYYTDTNLPPNFYRVTDSDYTGSGWSRGHMCPSADRTDTRADNDMVFLLSNLIPQAGNLNSGLWEQLEDYCRSLADAGDEVLVMCGPSRFTGATFASGHLAVPGYNWKIAVIVPPGSGNAVSRVDYSTRVIAINVTNSDSVTGKWTNYVTSVNELQTQTGFTFFTALPPNLAAVLRSVVDGQTPPAPGISDFAPASGSAGTSVTITGTNLNFTTNVTFQGMSASFSILSSTNLTVTVPAGATSGQIAVATLGGNANSPGSFLVGTSTTPDLVISATHSGAFTQGDLGDTYTIIVTNIGTAASTGAVSVVDTLPTGLTATALSGTDWTANLGTLTCTRTDALPAGGAYPAITLTVSVAADAPAGVTNMAVVSGGGDTNDANNAASDATTISPAAAPTATTGSATSVGTATATLNGTVNPNGQPAAVHFDYGLTTSYGLTVAAGSLSSTTTQAVNASLTGLAAGTTYHFRVAAANILGSAAGLDQTFATVAAGVPDLAVTVTHTGNFTQGDTGDTYTIVVTNVGTAASSGSITVTDALPAGLTATGISGPGWTPDLGTLTCTCSDSLAAGAAYPAITVTVSVATNAPASLTNTAIVSGGGETNSANDTASDPTTINAASTGGTITTLAGWDVSALSNYGPSPFSPTTNGPDLSVTGLTRGSGVGTSGNAAARAWGGNTWTDTSSAAAITANHFATFGVAANSGYEVSFTSISRFDYRHSGSGPTSGLLQYQIGAAAFSNITAVSYASSSSSGASLTPIDLSGFPDLQNVGAGTNVTFRIVNWGATSSGGTWYIFDVANSSAPDFVVQGTVSPVVAPVPDLSIGITHSGDFTQGDTGRTYTITVTNIGAGVTAGTVSVTNLLPAGLIVTALGGDGWTPDLSTLTCTRSDSLDAGAAYPPITVTVNVLANAPASVTNGATVSGGGEANLADNIASDPTSILAAAAPTVTTGIADGVGTSVATLNGMVDPNGQSAAVQFEYGLTAGYGAVLLVPGSLSGTTTQAIGASLPGLLPGTTYHFCVTATNVLGASTGLDQAFTTLAPIEAWRLQWFGTTADSGAAADTAIASGDGMPNLLKYALGLDPLTATNDPVAGDITTGYLRLSVPKNPQATDVSFQVEVTGDLAAAWTTNGTTIDTDTPTLLQAHQNTPVASSEGGFIRLRVSRP